MGLRRITEKLMIVGKIWFIIIVDAVFVLYATLIMQIFHLIGTGQLFFFGYSYIILVLGGLLVGEILWNTTLHRMSLSNPDNKENNNKVL